MDKLFEKIDDFNTTLWIETVLLVVAMSFVFGIALTVI